MKAYEMPFKAITLVPSADLTDYRYRLVNVDSDGAAVLATANGNAIGVLQEGAEVGAPANVMVDGISFVTLEGTVNAGDVVQVGTAGAAKAATTGVAVGVCLVGGTDGATGSILIRSAGQAPGVIAATAVTDLVAGNAQGAKASLDTGVIGDNNALTFTAKKFGAPGNDITVAFVDPEANDASIAVTVTGTAISVSLATDSGGTITSTGTTVIAAIEAKAEAAALVDVANTSTSTGAGAVVAFAAEALTGGVDSEGQQSLTKINEILAALRAAGFIA